MRFLLRRLGLYLLAFWAALTLNFVLPRLMPGDPATALLVRFRGQMQPEALRALREAFGFTEESLVRQYLAYVGHTLGGDLGISIAYFPAPVTRVLATGFAWTLALAGFGLLLSFALGSLLGMLSAWWRGGKLDSVVPPATTFLSGFPYFWLAMLALDVFALRLGWFPLGHAYGDDVSPGPNLPFLASALHHLALPLSCVVLASLGSWVLGMRNAMIGVLAEDYVTLARAKGLPPRRVLFGYVARNALLPNVTALGMAAGFVLSGSLLTEIVFSYPGLGYLLVQAVRGQDYPLMQGLFLLITAAVLTANFAVDLFYLRLDPRTRAR
jgi:peptide/nickel transport system permease protein